MLKSKIWTPYESLVKQSPVESRGSSAKERNLFFYVFLNMTLNMAAEDVFEPCETLRFDVVDVCDVLRFSTESFWGADHPSVSWMFDSTDRPRDVKYGSRIDWSSSRYHHLFHQEPTNKGSGLFSGHSSFLH